ncbi:hypothetical protein LTR85_007626 [Meristemomyces frigidus]|nr:hypothetical protein LTR85_007626 [Meristemomyces frigidus]
MADRQPHPSPLQRLPTELRMLIYRDVLRTDSSLLPSGTTRKQSSVNLDISLLLVDKATHTEAAEASFDVNTIRLSHLHNLVFYSQFGHGRADLLRHIELVNTGSADIWRDESYLERIISVAASLPRLRTITIGYDGLVKTGRTLYQWLQASGFGRQQVRCLAMGEFKLAGGQVKKVFLKHYGLVKAWRTMKAAPATPVTFAHLLSAMSMSELMAELTKADWKIWLAFFEGWRAVRARREDSNGIPPADRDAFLASWFETAYGAEPVLHATEPLLHSRICDGVLLTELTLERHGEMALAWASEVLVNSTHFFRKLFEG